ncbi:ArnT family glycosyltransferase [Siccirubricoccus phaeus]|uniref:ArnT family glycosyltransferase n=1 Tax=Siccirubricoccus phaeus TaxID=2595053 RepID=UPI0011F1F908|nr:glycosyltransferase family 39 protein [Siccirubricoccus phaeus]
MSATGIPYASGRVAARGGTALDLGLILLATLALRLPALSISVFDNAAAWDEHAFLLAGREVLHGHLPYLTFWDHKPPGTAVLLAGAMALLGPTVEAGRWLAILAVASTGWALYGIAWRVAADRLVALGAALLWVVFSARLAGVQLMTETLQAPFTAFAVLLLLDAARPRGFGALAWRFALAGLAGGVAVSVKYVPAVPVSLVAAAALLALLQARLGLLRCLGLGVAFSIGLLLPTAVAVGVFWQAGQLPEFWHANFGFAQRYVEFSEHVRGAWAERIRWISLSLVQIWPLFVLSAVALLPVSLRLLPRGFPLLALALWWVGEAIALCLQTRFFDHHFIPLLAPMAVVSAAMLVVHARRLAAPGLAPQLATLAIGALALMPLAQDVLEVATARFRPDVPRRVAAALPRGAEVYVANYAPVIYLLSDSPLATRQAWPSFLVGPRVLTDDVPTERARLLAEKPRFVVFHEAWRNNAVAWDAGALEAVEAMLAQDYVAREHWSLNDARGVVTLYERRG